MLQLCSLASGSSGNSIYIGSQHGHILVDCGVSGKRIEAGMAENAIDPKKLNGILITHEHSDHIKGLGVMHRRYKVPIYTTTKTWNALKSMTNLGKIDESLVRFIEPDIPFDIEDITVTPFRTPHDAVDSVCYTFRQGALKIGFATDLGIYDDYIIDHLKDSQLLYIESNHDVGMLEVGPYPYYLKQRILSNYGHLSNELSLQLIEALNHEGLQHIVLAHLSNENNHPEIAYVTVKNYLDACYIKNERQIELTVAKRDTATAAIMVRED